MNGIHGRLRRGKGAALPQMNAESMDHTSPKPDGEASFTVSKSE
jgi:hypothetical protein